MKRNFILVIALIFCAFETIGQLNVNALRARGIDPETGLPINIVKKQKEAEDDSFLTGSARYKASSVVPDEYSAMTFDVQGDFLYVNTGGAVVCYRIDDNSMVKTYPMPADYSGYPSFVSVSPDESEIWVGITSSFNVDDRIYSIDAESGDWEHRATLPGNFDLEFTGDNILVSGLEKGEPFDKTTIFLLDVSGANNHKKIIEAVGHVTGFSVDNAGNVYYASSNGASSALYRWNSNDVSSIINNSNDSFLNIANAAKLSDLVIDAYDCEVDEAGNVLFTINSFVGAKELCLWNGVEGNGNNYYVLASTNDVYAWLLIVKSKGNIKEHGNDNGVFTFAFGEPIAKISKLSPYISEVLEYTPAPGQFINDAAWGTPAAANSIVGVENGNVSLGAYGGNIVFKFDGEVENHPHNPYGIDFTILGNALASKEIENFGEVVWSEPGAVWVMKDENNDGLPNDTWYLLAGSDYWFSSSKNDYTVTYSNNGASADVPWYDNYGNEDVIIKLPGKDNYYPTSGNFPGINQESYSLSGANISGNIYISGYSIISGQRAFGYADNTPSDNVNAGSLPVNPYIRSNSGSDGFDISWAVDDNGEYVNLDKIHFVKVQTSVLANALSNGEISTEITGAFVIDPAPLTEGVTDMVVIKDIPQEITTQEYQLEVFAFTGGRLQADKNIVWSTDNLGATVGSDNILRLTSGLSGDITITASLDGNADIKDMVSTKATINSSINNRNINAINVYPNPATSFVQIAGVSNASITIYDMTGKQVFAQKGYNENIQIPVNNLAAGIYIIRVEEEGSLFNGKLKVEN